MGRKNIHLAKAAFCAQFKTAMQNCGVSPDYYFEQVGLPVNISDPEKLLPLKPLYRLANMVALRENIPDFGMRVAQTTPWHRVRSLAPLIQECKNLKDLLDTFCKVASSQVSAVVFDLKRDRSYCWFRYSQKPFYKNDVQMELYRITSMIELVQLATGTNWRPEQIHLLIPKTGVLESCALLDESKISFSKPRMALSFRPELLSLPIEIKFDSKTNSATGRPQALNSEFANSIRQIISSYVSRTQIKIEDIAIVADISVRTLQRHLAEDGLKFNDLLNQARYEAAKDKLSNSRLQVAEIAKSLGYSDPAHFNLAFRRWSELSPTGFRKNR